MPASPFPYASPVRAVPRKPRQPQTTELGFASKDRSAHPLPVLAPPLCHPLSILPTWRLEQKQLPLPLSLAGEGGLLLHQGRLPKAAAVRSRQGEEKKAKERKRGSGREAVIAALSSEQSEHSLGGAPAPGATSRALGLPHGSSSIASSAALQPPWGQPRIVAWPPAAPCQPRGSVVRGWRDTQGLSQAHMLVSDRKL